MSMQLTEKEAARLNHVLNVGETYSAVSPHKFWTEEMELEIVELIKSGKSVCSIIRDKKVSGKKIADIRRKHKLWGA
jgi:hypothetical protein